MAPPLEYFLINLVQQILFLPELPSKGHPALHNLLIMCDVQKPGLHLRRVVPGHVPQVVVHREVAEVRVARDRVEITFQRQHHVGEVHEKGSREVLPSENAVLYKPPV